MLTISWKIIALRLLLAAVLGAVIGLERERSQRTTAGMRTHMLVSVGSALIVLVSIFGFSDVLVAENVSLDPSRIAAQVVSGIGFIGAGAIMFLRPGFVKGLTTAAGLWTVAAIGLAAGAGLYFAGIMTTIIAFAILFILNPLEKRFSNRYRQKFVEIFMDLDTDPALITKRLMKEMNKNVNTFNFERTDDAYIIEIQFYEFKTGEMLSFLTEIEDLKGIQKVNWAK